jgi:hypothetical protein
MTLCRSVFALIVIVWDIITCNKSCTWLTLHCGFLCCNRSLALQTIGNGSVARGSDFLCGFGLLRGPLFIPLMMYE